MSAEDKPKLSKKDKKAMMEKLLEEFDTEDYITDNIKLYFGDCIERMKEIPDDSVNLILCDLPYGTTKCKWDTIIDMNLLWEHYRRILKKPTGVVVLFPKPFTVCLYHLIMNGINIILFEKIELPISFS